MSLNQYPQRHALHNEIHARPPESIVAPVVVSHIVMLASAAERAASRAHIAELLRNQHLPMPDASSTHLRMDFGQYRLRWEMHTEFVTYTFIRQLDAAPMQGTRAGARGHVHFSIAPLMENRKGITDQLRARAYQSAALAPATPWLGSDLPTAPTATARRETNGTGLRLSAGAGKPVSHYAIWTRYGAQWRFAVAPSSRPVMLLPDDAVAGAAQAVVVSAVDRLGNESTRVTVALQA